MSEAVRATEPIEGAVDIRMLGAAIWRRQSLLISLAFIVGLVVFAITSSMTPMYRSEARILIESPDSTFTRVNELAAAGPAIDEQTVQSQVQLILSRDLGLAVIRKLDLIENREFNPSGTGRSLFSRLAGFLGLGGKRDTAGIEERTLEEYYSRLSVYTLPGSRVIAIEFVSANADTAALVANTIADSYLEAQQSAKQSTTRQASGWLETEISRMRERVTEAEERVEQFRAKTGLFAGANNTSFSTQQLSELSTQLATARAEQAEAKAKADMIADVLKNNRPIESLDIVNSELIRRLAEQKVTLQAQLANELRTLLPGHPRIKALNAQLEDLEAQILIETRRVGRAYENAAKVADARVSSLLASIDAQKQAVAYANEQEVQLRALEREARAQRDVLEQFLARYREADARESLAALPPDARVISRAAASINPYFPRVIPMVVIAVAATLFVGVGIILAVELLKATGPVVTTREVSGARVEAPAVSGAVPVYGALPASHSMPARSGEPTSIPSATTAIEVADAGILDDLAEHLAKGGDAESAPRILVTSASTEVEPANIAIGLARSLAECNKKTIVVEIGGEEQAIKDLLGRSDLPGLVQVIDGDASFTQAIHRDPASGVHIIPYGSDELISKGIDELEVTIDALGFTYDFIVLSCRHAAFDGHEKAICRHAGAAILVASGSPSDPATVTIHDKLMAEGLDDVIVLMTRANDLNSRQNQPPSHDERVVA